MARVKTTFAHAERVSKTIGRQLDYPDWYFGVSIDPHPDEGYVLHACVKPGHKPALPARVDGVKVYVVHDRLLAQPLPTLAQATVRLRRDEERWLRAKSYDDLLRLNVLFLEGKIVAHPWSVVRPEDLLKWESPALNEETARIRDALVALNKLGLFTESSQPGLYVKTGRYAIEQRAYVDGYAPKALADRLLRALDGQDGLVALRPVEKPTKLVVVTRQGGPRGALKPFTWVGRATPVEVVMEGRIGSKALKELARCADIAAYDKKWRRNTHLWPALVAALKPRAS